MPGFPRSINTKIVAVRHILRPFNKPLRGGTEKAVRCQSHLPKLAAIADKLKGGDAHRKDRVAPAAPRVGAGGASRPARRGRLVTVPRRLRRGPGHFNSKTRAISSENLHTRRQTR